MIIFVEGLSKSGKTTLCKMLKKELSDVIYFKGAGQVNVGYGKDWMHYNFEMHRILERLDELNDYKKIILWDRGITETVYSEDENTRNNVLRIAKSHKQKAVIYINIPDTSVLCERDSKEGDDITCHATRYTNVIDSFEKAVLTPSKDKDYYITDEIVSKAAYFIKTKLAEIK